VVLSKEPCSRWHCSQPSLANVCLMRALWSFHASMLLLFCPCSWPALPSSAKATPALEFSLTPSQGSRPAGLGPQQQQLSVRAAPLSLTIAPELFSSLAAMANPLRAVLQSPHGSAAPAEPPEAMPAQAAAAGVETPVRGAVSLQRISLMVTLAAVWEEPGAAAASSAGSLLLPPPPASAQPGTAVPSQGEAAEIAFEEVAIMVHQAAESEGRPWFTGGEVGLTTTLEASLVAAELVVHHPGMPLHATTSCGLCKESTSSASPAHLHLGVDVEMVL
jgi:hypothetical protein